MQDLPGYGILDHPDKFSHNITIPDYETSRTVSFPGWTNDLVMGLPLKSLQYSYREVPRTCIFIFPGKVNRRYRLCGIKTHFYGRLPFPFTCRGIILLCSYRETGGQEPGQEDAFFRREATDPFISFLYLFPIHSITAVGQLMGSRLPHNPILCYGKFSVAQVSCKEINRHS